jgi:hypothetical protein
MASYLGSQKKFLPNLKQYEATTGRPISDKAMQNYLYASLQTEADRADARYARERQFELTQQGLDLQKQSIADTKSANKISGITQLAGLPLQGYLGYKAGEKAGLWGGTPAPTAAAPAVDPFAGAGTPVTTGTSQGLLTGDTGTVGAQTGLAAGTQAGLSTTATGAAAAGTAGYGMAEGAGSSGVIAGSEGVGLLGTYGPVAGASVAGMWGMNKLLGTGGPGHQGGEVHTSNILGGAAAGAAMGSIIPGVGTLVGGIIGGAIGAIGSLF